MLSARLETIDKSEVLLYLGYKGCQATEDVARAIDGCIGDIFAAARPKLTYQIFPWAEERLVGPDFPLEGRDIQTHLQECDQAVLMAATLGPDVETLVMRAQVTDMARALILDSCASAAIENVCNSFEARLRAQYEADGLFLTDRFSPGYGDMPISQQTGFCELLDTRRRIGLAVSQSGIMIPRKSVTAVLGVSTSPRRLRSDGCESCSMADTCQVRRSGGTCRG